MDVVLRSDRLIVSISKKGAELRSIKSHSQIELLWTGDASVWPRHAPILFPIVGKLRNNSYTVSGKAYSLTQHGFARDVDFTQVSHSENVAHFRLNQTAQSKNIYPFDFELDIMYELQGAELITTYTVTNPSHPDLLFSIGAHPGFRCPVGNGETFEDYYLAFERDQYLLSNLQDGLRSGTSTQLNVPHKKLHLNSSLFNNDALVFENNQIHSISLRSAKSAYAVTLHCKDWPYFGIWSKKGCTEFVCLEPWYGIADGAGHNGALENKEGVLNLKKGETFKCRFSLCFQGFDT